MGCWELTLDHHAPYLALYNEEDWESDPVLECLPSLVEALGLILALKTNKQNTANLSQT